MGSVFTGTTADSGIIGTLKTIGSIQIHGNLEGNAAQRATIYAGQESLTGIVIRHIAIQGDVYRADIFGGLEVPGDQILSVHVGGNWIASNLIAGARNLGVDDQPDGTGAAADDVNFGDSHDAQAPVSIYMVPPPKAWGIGTI